MPLHPFDPDAETVGTMQRFQWVKPNAVARSSQPGYAGHDSEHEFTAVDVSALQVRGIKIVISANEHGLSEAGKGFLATGEIEYFHFPVEDFQPHSARQLEEAGRLIRSKGPALVYCGYGQGRTGTVVAGWAICSREEGVVKEDDALRAMFGVETAEQIAVLLSL